MQIKKFKLQIYNIHDELYSSGQNMDNKFQVIKIWTAVAGHSKDRSRHSELDAHIKLYWKSVVENSSEMS